MKFNLDVQPSSRRLLGGKEAYSDSALGTAEGGDKEEQYEKTFEVSVEMESCVSSLELVQIQLEKQGEWCYMWVHVVT